ncbi:MAG: aminopeptidase [Patescibacteria group bacterium]|jgi:aminopeptidase
MDQRFVDLARVMVGHSTAVSNGDIVIVKSTEAVPPDMIFAVIQAVREAGGSVIPWRYDPRIDYEAFKNSTTHQLRAWGAGQFTQLAAANCFIEFRPFSNQLDGSDVPAVDMQRHGEVFAPLTVEQRVERTRWVLTRWPTPANAQLAGMSTSQFEKFFFEACLADYSAMAKAVKPLVALMEATKEVKIVGPGETNFTFSIEGVPVIACTGRHNIPDGEVYTAPVRESMNGVIAYNTLTVNARGQQFTNVRFVVVAGKIVEATCETGDQTALDAFLDTDEGARYFGEFALGVNNFVTGVIGETLFDEKVGGSFHLTPGQCYEVAPNGNKSAIHWDIVCDQRGNAGGGEIYFDDKLVRSKGLFIPKSLRALNP